MFFGSNSMPQRSSSEQCLTSSTPVNPGPSQILPFLYLGSQEDVLSTKTMQEHNITDVINVSMSGQKAPFLDEKNDDHFLRIPINDCLNAQLSPFFEQAFKFIEKVRQNGGRVFIHCLAGISRSPALAVAYVMRHLTLTADDAYRYIKARRPQISPNFNFLGQLYEYERSLPSTSGTALSHQLCSSSSSPSPTSISIPLVKYSPIDVSLNDRRRFLRLETTNNTSSSRRESNSEQTKVLSRPKGFNFELVNSDRAQSLLSPSSGIANLSVASPQAHSSLPVKLLRPNSITLKRSSPTDESSTPDESNKSNWSFESSSTSNKRVKISPRTGEASPLTEDNELINSFHEATDQRQRSNSNNSSPLSSPTKSRTNSLSSSRELLVS